MGAACEESFGVCCTDSSSSPTLARVSVRCGHCGGYHASAAEVRDCAGLPASKRQVTRSKPKASRSNYGEEPRSWEHYPQQPHDADLHKKIGPLDRTVRLLNKILPKEWGYNEPVGKTEILVQVIIIILVMWLFVDNMTLY